MLDENKHVIQAASIYCRKVLDENKHVIQAASIYCRKVLDETKNAEMSKLASFLSLFKKEVAIIILDIDYKVNWAFFGPYKQIDRFVLSG